MKVKIPMYTVKLKGKKKKKQMLVINCVEHR